MAYRTEPGNRLIPRSPLSFQDEKGDIVGTTNFLQFGVCVNWNREQVEAFKTSLRSGNRTPVIDLIMKLFESREFTILRCPQLNAYFLMGKQVEEYQLPCRRISSSNKRPFRRAHSTL